MTEQVNENSSTPTAPARQGELLDHARSSYQTMLAFGWILIGIGAVAFIIGWVQSQETYGIEADLLIAGGASAFMQWATLGVLCLVGAGIVNGLGKRKTE